MLGADRLLSAPLLNDGYAVFFNGYDEAPAPIQACAPTASTSIASNVTSGRTSWCLDKSLP